MRTILISLLLAGVASPALAAGPGRDGPRDRAERAEARAERKAERQSESPQRSAEPRNVESAPRRSFEPRNVETVSQRSFEPRNADRISEPRRIEPKPIEVRERRVDARRFSDGSNPGRLRGGADSVVETREADPVQVLERRSAGNGVRDVRLRDRVRKESSETIDQRNIRRAPAVSESGGLVQQKRPLPRVLERADRRISRTPILGTEPPPPRTATAIAARPARTWSHNWRHDRRYDWRDWRRRHRSRFFFGFYNDPFGWDYFRYGIGWRLWPSYYRSSFWLNDPWHWRLPPAYGPYRWVRYYNDALLVNIYTGQVVDVEYNFFW